MKHYLLIQTMDGQVYDTRNYGIKIKGISVPSVEWTAETSSIPGRSNLLELGSDPSRSSIVIDFDFWAYDSYHFTTVRDKIFRLFIRQESFYLTESRDPGKRIKVRAKGFTPDQVYLKGKCSVEFICNDVFFESMVRTSEDEFYYDSSKLQYGMGLITEQLVYKFTTTTFRVYNAGDITIDWRNQGVTLTYRGASNALRIRNMTTGADWRYQDSSTASDTIRLVERARATKNTALSIFGRTNMAAMTLAPGWNEFQISGTSGSFEVTFDFRFLYL